MRCGWLAGLCVPAGDVRQELRWPHHHGTHGDGRDGGHQRCAVRWPVLPEPCGISSEVPAGRRPGHRSAVRAVRFAPIRAVASPLLCGGRSERGALLQRPRTLPWREGGWGRLQEALRPGAPGACGTGFAGGAPGPPGVGGGVGVGTSGLVRLTGCGVSATVPPRPLGAQPPRGAANRGGPGGWTCP